MNLPPTGIHVFPILREGEGGKIWENGIETCKISCMKRVASQVQILKKKKNFNPVQREGINKL